jgi:hypothetical protein
MIAFTNFTRCGIYLIVFGHDVINVDPHWTCRHQQHRIVTMARPVRSWRGRMLCCIKKRNCSTEFHQKKFIYFLFIIKTKNLFRWSAMAKTRVGGTFFKTFLHFFVFKPPFCSRKKWGAKGLNTKMKFLVLVLIFQHFCNVWNRQAE